MPNLRQGMMGAAGAGGSTAPVGEMWAWGTAYSGALGDGTTVDKSSPIQVGALTDWLTPICGSSYRVSGCVKSDGTLWDWGYNYYGQLGDGTTVDKSSPIQIGSLTNWFNGGGGDYHQIAIKTDGSLWSWGYSSYGQCGHNNTTNYSSPVQVGSLTNWKGVTAEQLADGYPVRLGVGSYNGIVIKDDGTLWSWGRGSQYTGGWGDNLDRSSPVQIGSGTDWQSIAQGFSYNTIATKTDGTLWAWGSNGYGQLGQGNIVSYNSPVQVGALTTWKYVGAGYNFSHMVKTDGTLWFMGRNNAGQGGTGNLTDYSSPVQIGSDTDWGQVICKYEGFAGFKTDGTLWMSGVNTYGQLGLGDTTNRSSPVQVGLVTSWSKMMCGKDHTSILR